ncbi:MAG: precorrin-6A reductase [Ruminococcus sp.]|nr:precorrin-6A reductase [Ruminococcus sp.]
MCKILIFGGTTEGRMLAEFCAQNRICASVSVTTEYGASLLPENENIKIHIGKLDFDGIKNFIAENNFNIVIDATHPYAVLATENISTACREKERVYYRLIREDSTAVSGETAESMKELVDMLNRSDKKILCTLGSKELAPMTGVKNYGERVSLRLLPADGISEYCKKLGFDGEKIIFGKGPFSEDENIRHIRKSKAEILVTKESGNTGGYPQKTAAAKACGIEVITLKRPRENGFSMNEIKKIICEKTER